MGLIRRYVHVHEFHYDYSYWFSSLASSDIQLCFVPKMSFNEIQTFMLPSITFSRPCRSTLNGVCAASGKLGALLGSSIFLPLATWLGNDKVMIACASVSILAAIMTLFLTNTAESELEDGKKATRVSSEAHLVSLVEAPSCDEDVEIRSSASTLKLQKVGSMPTFLDFR